MVTPDILSNAVLSIMTGVVGALIVNVGNDLAEYILSKKEFPYKRLARVLIILACAFFLIWSMLWLYGVSNQTVIYVAGIMFISALIIQGIATLING